MKLIKYVLFLVFVLWAVNYGVFLKYYFKVRDLTHISLPLGDYARGAKVTPELLSSVGALVVDFENRKTFFSQIAKEKKGGAIRVGAFGDSFTYGDEAGKNHDFPSLLQDLFHQRGYKNVEVLNFGNGWQGFHQAARIWELAGKAYDLDVILLGPECFQVERDSTFNHGLPAVGHYIHGRYVLDVRQNVRFINVSGGFDFDERFSDYFSFIPIRDYLKYDRHAPAFMTAWVPFGRELSNPFYYTKEPATVELAKIDRILIQKMAESVKQVILFNRMDWLLSAARDIENVVVNPHDFEKAFPFLRQTHFHGMGNRNVAQHYFDALTGNANSTTLHLAFEPSSLGPNVLGQKHLDDFEGFEVLLGEKRLAHLEFYEFSKEYLDNPVSLKNEKIKSLLFISGDEGESLLDGYVIGFTEELKFGDKITALDNSKRLVELGRPTPLGGIPNVGFLKIPGLWGQTNRHADATFSIDLRISVDKLNHFDPSRGEPAPVKIADKTVGEIAPDPANGFWTLRLKDSRAMLLRAAMNDYVDLYSAPKAGPLTFRLTGEKPVGGNFGRYSLNPRVQKLDLTGLKYTIPKGK